MGVLKNVGIALDQTGNCLIRLSDGWGTPDGATLPEQHPEIVLSAVTVDYGLREKIGL